MSYRARCAHTSTPGFTLVELLIVLAILAVLLSITAYGTVELTRRAKQTAMLAEKERVQHSIDTYNIVDVGVDDAEEIQGLTGLACKLSPDSTAPFATYLREETQFYYAWQYRGEELQVFDSPEESASWAIASAGTSYGDVLTQILAMADTKADRWRGHNGVDTSWDRRLELLLEQGHIGAPYTVPDGSNSVNYVNPVSGKASIINWNTLSGLSAYIPPAVFITANPAYSYEQITKNSKLLSTVIGSIVFYQEPNSTVIKQYSVNPDGTLSELIEYYP